MPIITDLRGRVCYNSRGEKSIEVDIVVDNKYLGRASAPSGASKGKYECIAFPKGIDNAIFLLNTYKSRFIGVDASDPRYIYNILKDIDNTTNYSIIGGSLAYSISIAAVDAAAKALNLQMFELIKKHEPYNFPYPLGNVLGGGAHAGPGTPDIQEILVLPIGASNIVDALDINFKIHRSVRDIIVRKDRYFTFGRGDEGGWAPRVNNEEALCIVEEAIEEVGYTLAKDVAIGIDLASSTLWDGEYYVYKRVNKKLSKEEQIEYVSKLIKDYKLIYVEDPLHEEAFEDMKELNLKFPNVYITGDDLLVTNRDRLRIAISHRSCNSAILKVNQAGSLYDALMFAEEAQNNKVRLITSHRSGESIDPHITHIAIATNSKMLKAGIVGGERIAKLNELLRINELGKVKGMVDLFN